ncbi:MAG: peptidoglycan LD-endopeptidase LytH [Actinomycetota bacterium]|nr:peptidoglycan LD-endopeptidase LytH [Actinomycetota bacterium]
MPSVRTCLLAATAATAALFVTLAAAPVEAQLIPFPTPLLPGLVGPTPSASAPSVPAPPPRASAPVAKTKPAGNAPHAPQNTRASSPSKKSPSVQAATSAGSGPARAPSFIRTGPASTAGLITDIAPLVGDGMASRDALILAGPPFPVAGMAKYSDDFLTPRLTPVPHLHQGTDVFADFGTPIVASGPGRVTQRDSAPDAGGLEMWVAGDDGVNYYYAHLLSFADTGQVGRTVKAGTILGYVGNTGDASGGPPHLHFEIHPPGSGRDKVLAAGVPVAGVAASSSGSINPKPILDAWLAQAEQHALAMAAKPDLPDTPPDLTLSGRSGKPAELVWFSVFQPSLGSLGLALQAANAAGTVDEKATSSEAASADVQRRAEIGLAVRTPSVHLGELADNGSGSAMDQLIGAGSP